jgi:hypothetical protein
MLTRILSACLLAMAAGCGKAPSSPASQPTPSPGNAVAATDSAVGADPAAPAVTTDETRTAALLAELTQAVRKYGVEKRRVPKTLEELVAGGYLSQVPQPPPGKRFAIDKKLQVNLVDE